MKDVFDPVVPVSFPDRRMWFPSSLLGLYGLFSGNICMSFTFVHVSLLSFFLILQGPRGEQGDKGERVSIVLNTE